MDPLHALAEIFVGWHRDKVLERWLKFLLSACSTYLLTFSGVAGWDMKHGAALLLAVGDGMVQATGATLALVMISPLGRGLAISLPKTVPADLSQYQVSSQGEGK